MPLSNTELKGLPEYVKMATKSAKVPVNWGWTETHFYADNWLPTLTGKVVLWKFKNQKSESAIF